MEKILYLQGSEIMVEKLLDILRTFFEKYFIQAIIAIIPTIIIYYFTPEDMNFFIKVGKEMYLLFCFICCFLIVELIIYIFKYAKNKIYCNKLNKKQSEKIMNENLNYIWDYVDSLDYKDKEILNYCLKNKNKVINIVGGIVNYNLFEEWFDETQIVSDGTIKHFNCSKAEETDIIEKGSITYQYKIRDDIYEVLEYSNKKYGRISHFK